VYVELDLGPDVQLEQVYGYPLFSSQGRPCIKIGSLRAGVNRDVLMRMRYGKLAVGSAELGTFTLRFKDMLADGAQAESRAPLAVEATDDQQVAASSEITEVTVRAAEVQAAQELERAARAVALEQYEEAEQYLAGSISRLTQQARLTPSAALDEQIKQSKKARSGIAAAKTSAAARKHYIKSSKSSAYSSKKSSKIPTKTRPSAKSSSKTGSSAFGW
jgi:hypothetical protein